MFRISFLFHIVIYFYCSFATAENDLLPNIQQTTAKIKGFIITSDSMERDLESEILNLEGNVKVIYKNQYFEADFIRIDLKRKQAYLKNNVKVQSLTHQIGGKEIIMDYEAGQGLIFYGYVQSNNVRFQGDLIEQQNENEFYVNNADYTTCSNCPPVWSFDGTKVKAELGGYAYIKNSLLKVSGIPIFWLPYLVVPLKSERQTGLLTPEIGYIRNRRLVVTQSLFWAASRSQDMTFTFKNYELGGLKPMIEHRYMVGSNSGGTTKIAALDDKVFISENRFNTYKSATEKESNFTRWSINSSHIYSPKESHKLRAQVSLVSDLQYPKDFYDEFSTYSDPALDNRISYTKNFTHSYITTEATYYKNLLQADLFSKNDYSVHKLPEIRFDSTIKRVSDLPLYYSITGAFTRFSRDKAYDDIDTAAGQRYVLNSNADPYCENQGVAGCVPVSDGVFNENNDIIRTGDRFNLKFSVFTDTYNLGNFINLSPKLSFNETDYLFPVGANKTSTRRSLQFELNTRTKFYKIYDSDYLLTGKKYKNEIIPEVKYSYVPWIQQDSNPFFGSTYSSEAPYSSRSIITDSDVNTLGGVLFDYEDRVYDRHTLSFSLLNRLVRKRQKDNNYKTILNFRLTQSYDFYQAQNNSSSQPLSDLAGTLTVDLDQFQSYTQINYYPYLSATNTTTSLSYLNDRQQYVKVGLTSTKTQTPQQDDLSLAVGFVSNYINLLTGVVFDASAGREYSSRFKKISLITQLKPPGECWAINFYRDQKVGLEAEWKIRFDFSFDGKPTKVIPPAELNIN